MATGKFLMLSGAGDGLGLALRLRQEGNDVTVWIREGRAKSNYDGLLKKVTGAQWGEVLDESTVVVFDSSGGGRTADRLRARGYPVFAGSTFADQLELDRAVAMDFMQQVGIKIPETRAFNSWEKAKTYVKERDVRLVFKPSGDSADQLETYAAYDTADMLEQLDHFAEVSKGKPDFILQDFVKGTAVSTEGWFNGTDFMTPFNHTVERKQLMNDNLGPSGGCAGNIVWLTREMNSIIRDGIQRMTPILREREYIGPIDLNAVVNDEGVWGLEFTPRFGYDALPALMELFEKPIGETITAMAKGEHPKTLPLRNQKAGALRVTIPPYPTERFHPDEGVPIRGLTRDDRTHLYFYDVKLDERNRLVSTSATGAIVAITWTGDDFVSVIEEPMAIAEKAKIPNKQYRTDLSGVLLRDWSEVDRIIRKESVDVGLSQVEV